MKTQAGSSRWQGWVMLILGLWLFSSPAWLHGFVSKTSAAAVNAYLIGVILIGFGWSALMRAKAIEDWVEMALDLGPYRHVPIGRRDGAPLT
jgi:hypothetical protein